jgi:hypothetical protein
VDRVREFLRHAFAVERPEEFAATDEEKRVVDFLAERVVRHGMTLPAVMFLESARPMNFVGAQVMAFFEPVVRGLLDWRGYAVLQALLHRRGSIPMILDRIEYFAAAEGRPPSDETKPTA